MQLVQKILKYEPSFETINMGGTGRTFGATGRPPPSGKAAVSTDAAINAAAGIVGVKTVSIDKAKRVTAR